MQVVSSTKLVPKMEPNKPIAPMDLAVKWKTWLQEFEIYATAMELDKEEEKIQCAQLLHLMGRDAIRIYTSFTFAEGEKDEIAVLKQKFEAHFVPKKNLTYERYKFITCRQKFERIEEFVTILKNRANQCEFGDPIKEDLIKLMLIVGIKDEATREKLLQKEELTLDKAMETCILTESARSQLKEMSNKETEGREVDIISRKESKKRKPDKFKNIHNHKEPAVADEHRQRHRSNETHHHRFIATRR